jgi:hypothetical protein
MSLLDMWTIIYLAFDPQQHKRPQPPPQTPTKPPLFLLRVATYLLILSNTAAKGIEIEEYLT